MIGAVVLDIEGTTSPATAVTDGLFPYARARFADWVGRDDPGIATIRAEVRRVSGRPDAGPDELAEILREWTDSDQKTPALKTLQGLIWAAGFDAGHLAGQVYPDVPAALHRWVAAGHRIYIYSSGSVLAQRLWFTHSGAGDLTRAITGYFDSRTAGPKREPESYRRITAALAIPPARTAFLSDVAAELDAAATVGWQTVLVRRPGEAGGAADTPARGLHRVITSFDEMCGPSAGTAGEAARMQGHCGPTAPRR